MGSGSDVLRRKATSSGMDSGEEWGEDSADEGGGIARPQSSSSDCEGFLVLLEILGFIIRGYFCC